MSDVIERMRKLKETKYPWLDLEGDSCPKCGTTMVQVYDDDPYQVCPNCHLIYLYSHEDKVINNRSRR